jgi:hypothetical protein
MRRCFPTLILISLLACQSKERVDSSTRLTDSSLPKEKLVHKQTEKTAENNLPIVSPEEMQTFWNECIEPIKNRDTEKLKRVVNFPLGGDWGSIIGPEEGKELSEVDFYNNLDSIFYPELLDSLRRKTIQDIEVYETENRQAELQLSVGWEKWIDDFKAESATIFRFKKINGKWMLCAIQIAG